MSEAKVTGGTFTLDNGETAHFSLSAEYGWQQWGAVQADLAITMSLTEAVLAVAYEEGILEDSDWDNEEEDF